MPRPTRGELESYRDAEVPDLIGPDLRLLVVGINPGLWTAATQAHFAHPANRFYPALHRAGVTRYRIDATSGMSDEDRAQLLARGVGISNLVPRATARASELTSDELRAGVAHLERLVHEHRPRVVAVLGLSAYRTAFSAPRATAGPQPTGIGRAQLWVLPNPSGLNAHETIDSLASAYGEAARAAGISLEPPG